MVSVGTIIWLSSELMFFATLFAAYYSIRAVSPELWAQSTTNLNVPFASVNTTILVLSSFTCQMGVFAAEAGRVGRTGKALTLHPIKEWGLREWFVLTYVMGAIFIGGQAFEYTELVHEGITIPHSAYGTMFYLTTGFHGLHVIGGLIAFIFLLARTTMSKFTPAQATAAIVVSYYWHFVDLVWIALFAMIYLLQ
jgi:cytochrome c oxidase subunit 3